ncbi:MAG: hypothetical protein COB09_01145 [Thalassobium sp.]|nr:MAG: hypothetical protein COB09_01145 [Thalassobium sp.]
MRQYRGRKHLIVTLLFLFFLPLTLWASSPVLLPNASFDYPITPYISVYEDPGRTLDIHAMLSREQQLRFTPSHARRLKFGISDSNYWLRFSLNNPYAQEREVVFTLSDSDIDDFSFYDISDAQAYRHIGHDDPARSLRGGFMQAFPVVLKVPAQSTRSYLVRIHSYGLLSTNVTLLSLDHFLNNEQGLFMLQGMSLGWILATLAWFIFVLRSQRILLAAAGSAYCATMIIYQPAWMGQFSLLLNISPIIADKIGELSLAASATCQTLAALALGWSGIRALLYRRLLLFIAILHLPVALITLWLAQEATLMVVACMIVANEFIVALILFRGRSQHPQAQSWLLMGHLLVGFGVLLAILTSHNLLSLDLFTSWAPVVLPFIVITSLVLAIMSIKRQQHPLQSQGGAELRMTPALLSQISHELRTPINGVIGMTELLGETPLSANQRDFSDTIALAGRDLLHVANEISDLARIQNAQLELEERSFSTVQLLNQAISHFQQEASRKQVELVLDMTDDLPEYFVGDRNRLQTLLHNVLARALAYTEYGELSLQASHYHSAQGNGLRVQIQLSSTIVKQDELKNAFAILQHHLPLAENHNAKSWNLLVTRNLLQKMKATLEVESMTSQGASLTLYLPMEAEAASTETSPLDDSLIGQRILIVDDNASLRNVIEKQVRRWGMRPDSTYSGKEALAMLRNQISIGQPYDFIIIDHDMPIMDGLQLAERIRSDKDIRHKPARLMLTGLSISTVRKDAEAVGIKNLLAKPASGERLRQALLTLKYQPQEEGEDTLS